MQVQNGIVSKVRPGYNRAFTIDARPLGQYVEAKGTPAPAASSKKFGWLAFMVLFARPVINEMVRYPHE
jgi:hypothetical protein